jgi:hypothetical protein
MRKAVFALAALLALPAQANEAQASPVEIEPSLRQVGQAEFRYLFWDIFDASLYAAGQTFSWQAPFALSLEYRRDFSAEDLTKETIKSLDRMTDWPQAELATFRTTLARCMANVRDGDRFTAVSPDADTAVLFLNGKERCRLEKSNIRRDYFSIWLSANGDFPEETRKLLGTASP